MLTRIHVDNYKCLTNFDLRLSELTLLVGGNGCGKSAVFEVVNKLREFLRGERSRPSPVLGRRPYELDYEKRTLLRVGDL